jgi:hypothetical protein
MTCFKRARVDEEEEEEEMVAVLIAYTDYVERCKAICSHVQGAAEAAIDAYVKSRGGEKNMWVFAIPSVQFDPLQMCAKSFCQEFRFTQGQLNRVVLGLLSNGFPKTIVTKARDKCSLHDALCMLCMKFAWPTRLGSMVKLFGCSISRMSRIVSHLRRLLFLKFVPALNSPALLDRATLERFCSAVFAKSGFPGRYIFGFIDGTVRPICKPKHLQSAVYNGKDRLHALKYQAVVTPDGMLQQLGGPWPGARHDMHMVRQSCVLPYLRALPTATDGSLFSIYADCGYAEAPGLVTPYFDGAVNVWHEAINQAMASSRIAVEWAFGDIVLQWSHVDFTRTNQLLSNRKCAQVYLVAGLMTNFLNCFVPNRGSQYFKVQPPVFEEYLAGLAARTAAAQGEANE